MRLVEAGYTLAETKGTNNGYNQDLEDKNEKGLR